VAVDGKETPTDKGKAKDKDKSRSKEKDRHRHRSHRDDDDDRAGATATAANDDDKEEQEDADDGDDDNESIASRSTSDSRTSKTSTGTGTGAGGSRFRELYLKKHLQMPLGTHDDNDDDEDGQGQGQGQGQGTQSSPQLLRGIPQIDIRELEKYKRYLSPSLTFLASHPTLGELKDKGIFTLSKQIQSKLLPLLIEKTKKDGYDANPQVLLQSMANQLQRYTREVSAVKIQSFSRRCLARMHFAELRHWSTVKIRMAPLIQVCNRLGWVGMCTYVMCFPATCCDVLRCGCLVLKR
jgi:hypothetical protein